MLQTFHNFGPLRVVLNDATGEVLAVQDRITGCDARFLYSLSFVARARASAVLAWESMYAGAC